MARPGVLRLEAPLTAVSGISFQVGIHASRIPTFAIHTLLQ